MMRFFHTRGPKKHSLMQEALIQRGHPYKQKGQLCRLRRGYRSLRKMGDTCPRVLDSNVHFPTCSMSPAFVIVICTICAKTSSNWLTKSNETFSFTLANDISSSFAHHVNNIHWTVHLNRKIKK